ncbi:uncharacterized protein LOC142544262 [Primulina tabacum]|uniref:uncharacterized protein LOC142544262 n=1 Tax=Primulina tabacum TaxID=48773 RepID=UPI003F59B970
MFWSYFYDIEVSYFNFYLNNIEHLIGDIESAPQTCNEAEFVATGQGNTTSDESERFISNKTVERAEAAFKKRKKLQVVRQRASGVTIIGSSNRISSVNVDKVLNKQTHVIVKGRRNFVTVSSLRASLDDQRKKNTDRIKWISFNERCRKGKGYWIIIKILKALDHHQNLGWFWNKWLMTCYLVLLDSTFYGSSGCGYVIYFLLDFNGCGSKCCSFENLFILMVLVFELGNLLMVLVVLIQHFNGAGCAGI